MAAKASKANAPDAPSPVARNGAKRPRIPNVALLVSTNGSYGRNILRGIGEYARLHGPWIFHLPTVFPVTSVPDRGDWWGDGIIAQPHQNQRFVQQLAECGLPVVSLSGPPGAGGLPAVRANQESVADVGLQHFADRGFTRMAYCGIPSETQWPPIGEMFKAKAERAGYRCDLYLPAFHPDARTLRLNHLAEWLTSLQKPVGLLAGSDLRAREVLDACRLVGLLVPDEVAVLGVNDDEMVCEMAIPALSSIVHNARRIGYEAAAMLDGLMKGRRSVADVVIDPLGVHSRQSTDLLAIEDPDVARVVRYIREHACKGARVDDLLGEVAMSRRSLEKRFRTAVGRPVHAEIRRVQIEKVKELLLTTDYKLERIADLTGFSTAQYLAGLFHKMVKVTPGAFRTAGRGGGMRPTPTDIAAAGIDPWRES